MTFYERKQRRTRHYYRHIHGYRLRPCTACNGSGHYDAHRSPGCGACDGTGKERYRGPKALPLAAFGHGGHVGIGEKHEAVRNG